MTDVRAPVEALPVSALPSTSIDRENASALCSEVT